MTVEVLRIGQRLVRDDRVTTHAALVSRAFGASRIYMTEINPEIKGTIQSVNEAWGGNFEVVYVEKWKPIMREKKTRGHAIVHLSMYGEPINRIQDELRSIAAHDSGRNMLIVVGAGKVPREVYDAADYNVSVGVQPHSEIAALAVLFDRVYGGGQFDAEFKGAKWRIIPSRYGKNVAETDTIQGQPSAENNSTDKDNNNCSHDDANCSKM